jgi:hypothetical protein
MFKLKVLRLINHYGVKRESIIETIGSNRVTFQKKLKDNSFTYDEMKLISEKYGFLIK